MSIETTLYTRLTTHAGLAALTGTRVYPGHLPPGYDLDASGPAISYRRVSAARFSAMAADAGVVRARFQFDVWARGYGTASGLRPVVEQLRAALQRWSTTTGTTVDDAYLVGDQDLYEPDTDTHHAAVDFDVIYRE